MDTIIHNENANLPNAGNAKGVDKKRIIILVLALAGLLAIMGIALFGYIWWKQGADNNFGNGEAEKITEDATKGTLPSVSTNPLESRPNLNPAEQSNPINAIKINPFE